MRREHIVEILTPKQSNPDFWEALMRMGERYQHAIDAGFSVSIPDNPMGVLRFQITEVMAELGLSVPPGRVVLHLNTFHTKESIDEILRAAAELGIERMIVVSGDGGERLTRLKPQDIGSLSPAVTSVELTRYIHSAYPHTFVTGVAFNPYEPPEYELVKLGRKADAGAQFVVTQPVMSSDPAIRRVIEWGLPVTVGVWMSRNIKLLSECVGHDLGQQGEYDPIFELGKMHKSYPGTGIYLSMVKIDTELAAVSRVLQKQAPVQSPQPQDLRFGPGRLLMHPGIIHESV